MTALVKINKNNYVDKYAKYKNIGLVKHTEKIVYENEFVKSLNQNQFTLISTIFMTIIGSMISMLGISSIISNSVLILFLCILIDVFKTLKSLN
ncbi:Uncharacterised protein [[Clostridium] sordellii]|uniref:hypothetical protein n=1 Tax=Paraclostridium sordellii TaxID=1505 RepID=UPI0005E71373|nr:hypothetical protein [Paeniclostridium sordellii]CEQ01693.1 Uncharacterised protein [[Clostridium] sordellii] [Paeniclostridium sordellii]